MACTNPQNPSCPNCNKSGLAILPVRYCVVPKEVDAFVPAPLGNKVLTVPLRNHNYALRTLRQGFLYLFYEKHPSGSHIKWEVFAVSEAGTLWKMPSASAIRLVSEEPQCARNGHNLPASVITIEEPQHCKRVWLAFSEHMWSAETLADFERDVKLRDRRMQCLEPATWIAAGGYGGEKMIQHLLSIRALVDPADSLQLIRVQSKEEGIARQQTMERLRTARTFLMEDKPEMRTVQAEKLRAAWEGFKNSGTHTNAVKDIRLNLLVMFIEGGNFAKMMGEVLKKNDKKSWLALAASGMTITAGLFDITATLVKGIAQDAAGDFDKGASLWSYQRLKLAGGLLSAGGSAIGAYLDYEEASKAVHRKRWGLVALYGAKFAGGTASAMISIATGLTYSAPYVRHITARSVLVLTAKKVGQKEIPLLVARGLLMTMGGALSIALFTLQVLIWIFDEGELQIWCSLCPFGEKRDTPAGYTSNSEQMLALNKALVELALAPPAKEENSERAWGSLQDPTLEELRMYF